MVYISAKSRQIKLRFQNFAIGQYIFTRSEFPMRIYGTVTRTDLIVLPR